MIDQISGIPEWAAMAVVALTHLRPLIPSKYARPRWLFAVWDMVVGNYASCANGKTDPEVRAGGNGKIRK